jgi:hypothetical protein
VPASAIKQEANLSRFRGVCTRTLVASLQLPAFKFLLGHVSVQTTEGYLGCKQRIRNAVNDHIGLEPVRS